MQDDVPGRAVGCCGDFRRETLQRELQGRTRVRRDGRQVQSYRPASPSCYGDASTNVTPRFTRACGRMIIHESQTGAPSAIGRIPYACQCTVTTTPQFREKFYGSWCTPFDRSGIIRHRQRRQMLDPCGRLPSNPRQTARLSSSRTLPSFAAAISRVPDAAWLAGCIVSPCTRAR